MNEYIALIAAIVVASLIAVAAVGVPTVNLADRIFNPNTADFSAKFIRP